MRQLATFFLLLAAMAAAVGLAYAQTPPSPPLVFNCIVGNTLCPDGSTPLSGFSSSTPPTYVSAAGYFNASDGGGGDFFRRGSIPTVCKSSTQTQQHILGTVGGSTISGVAIGGLVVGELVSGSGSDSSGSIQTQPGAEVASISTAQVTLTLPLTGTATDQSTPFTSVTFTGSNGGTLIVDAGSDCWQKTNYRGEPHEWGAWGDGGPPNGHDDTTPLQNWLGAYGNVNANAILVPATAPSNFGPWIATVPANYYVSTGLVCPANAVLQGPANALGGSVQGISGAPPVRIFAGTAFPSQSTALLTAEAFCRISGITLDANGQKSENQPIDVVDIAGPRVTIDDHTFLENGNYGVNCTTHFEGLEIKDAQVWRTSSDGLFLANCANARLTGDLIESTQGNGITIGGRDVTLADGIVEGSGAADVSIIAGAAHVGVTGMMLNTGGQGSASSYYPNIDFAGSQSATIRNVTICGNRLTAPGHDASNTAQVRFGGLIDNLTLCGNTYASGNVSSDANVNPWYVYDVNQSNLPSLTNAHIYENATQAGVAIFSPAAQPVLSSLVVPQFTQNQISGLTLSNDGGSPNTVIDVAAGSATDSSNSTLITLPAVPGTTPACTVDFTKHGAGGLDSGGAIQTNKTYFIYAIAPGAASGNPAASCMASTSLVPDFNPNYFANTGYIVAAVGGTLGGAQPSNTVFNVQPTAGVRVGNVVTNSPFPPGTTVTAFSVNTAPSPQPMVNGMWTPGSTTVPVNSAANVQLGMVAVDPGNNNCFPTGTYVQQTNTNVTPNTITVSQVKGQCSEPSGTSLSISGAQQLVLSCTPSVSCPTGTNAQAQLDIEIGYYRMIGAVNTDSSANLVKFTQDNDTFYLQTPVNDISTISLSNTPTSFALQSVPSGVSVEAMGRCVANHMVHIFSPGQAPGTPASFPNVPGFDTETSIQPDTSFPFRNYTDTAQHIFAQASTLSTFYCMTDGWVLKR